MKLSEAPTVHPTARVMEARLGRWTEIGERSHLLSCDFGDYSYIAGDGQITYASVGKMCSLASHVRIGPTNHPMERVTTHHFTYRAGDYFEDAENDESIFEWRRSQWIIVGHDVWIGHNATVMPGVTVGTGVVVGAGAIVTKDIPDYWIAVGVPARPLRRRFDERAAERLKALAYWDWSHAALRAALRDFQTLSVDGFIEKYDAAR